jgi:outer membrane protein TolC
MLGNNSNASVPIVVLQRSCAGPAGLDSDAPPIGNHWLARLLHALQRALFIFIFVIFLGALCGLCCFAQLLPEKASPPVLPATPLTITLADAITRARANSPEFLAVVTDAGLAREDRVQARAAMLPALNYTTGFLYTEGNRTAPGVYLANNGVHEYISQGNAHEVIGLSGQQISEYRRAREVETAARLRQEIATRGLVSSVVQHYYDMVVAERKHRNAEAAKEEAERFLNLSQKLEHGGEVAHADVIKAKLQFNDRERELREANLAVEKARLTLAVLLFPAFNQDFSVVDDLRQAPALPALSEAEKMAAKDNPDLKVALAGVQIAQRDIEVAWAGHLPTLTLDTWYGIDASHFATYNPDGSRNLGYSAAATLNIPVWNWGATQSKVRQAELRREQAKTELSFAQRQLVANLHSYYTEAQVAHDELEALRQSADLAAESLRLTTLRYQGGEATALEVVDAQTSLVAARNAADDGEARYREALAALQTLTGDF